MPYLPNRQRTIYQSSAVFAGPDIATGTLTASGAANPGLYGYAAGQLSGNSLVNQLSRVQSTTYTLQIPRIDVNQFGELAAIDRPSISQPSVTLDLNYLIANLANENYMGLTVTPTGSVWALSCISGILTKVSDERNMFIVDSLEGQDVNNNAIINIDGTKTYGFGNMFLSSYNINAQVGQLPTADVRFEGLNMTIQSGIFGNTSPAVFPADGTSVTGWFYKLNNSVSNANPGTGDLTISAIRPGDITFRIFNSGVSTEYSDMGPVIALASGAVQSCRLGFDLRREDLLKLGSKFAYSKEIQFPVTINCSLNALVKEVNTGDLASLICLDKSYDVELDMYRPGCTTDTNRPIVARHRVLGVKLDGQNYGLQIGQNKTVTYDFSRQIGSPSQQVGWFMSGVIGTDAA